MYSAGGGSTRPAACGNATLSGEYSYDASGFTLSGTAQTGSPTNPAYCSLMDKAM